MRSLLLALLLAFGGVTAQAQVAPSAAEVVAYTGLHLAAHKGDTTKIQRLVASGAVLNATDAYGRTPLHVAAFARQREAIRALAKAGAHLNRLETSRYDGTALIAAAHLGHDGVVRQLIAAGAPLDHVNNLHWTAVIESIVLGDGGPRHQATLKALIDAGANLQLTDRSGQTPLALAKARGFNAMVTLLEKAGAR